MADGSARYLPQAGAEASHQGLVDDDTARIDWSKDARHLDRWVRGCDPQPGAWGLRGPERIRLFDGRLEEAGSEGAAGEVVAVAGNRLYLAAREGRISVGRVRIGEGPKQAAGEAGLVVGERLR